MSNPMLHATLLALLIVGLVGCSSTEDKVYQSFRCAKVASLLGEERDALKAMEKSAEDRGVRSGQAGIEGGIAQFPGQDEGIAQSQVEPLAGNRMQHLCRVADPLLAESRGLPTADAEQQHGHGRRAHP